MIAKADIKCKITADFLYFMLSIASACALLIITLYTILNMLMHLKVLSTFSNERCLHVIWCKRYILSVIHLMRAIVVLAYKTVVEKFRARQYKSITEFISDMHLMIENCYRYNGPDHPVSKKAMKLEVILEQKLVLLPR